MFWGVGSRAVGSLKSPCSSPGGYSQAVGSPWASLLCFGVIVQFLLLLYPGTSLLLSFPSLTTQETVTVPLGIPMLLTEPTVPLL